MNLKYRNLVWFCNWTLKYIVIFHVLANNELVFVNFYADWYVFYYIRLYSLFMCLVIQVMNAWQVGAVYESSYCCMITFLSYGITQPDNPNPKMKLTTFELSTWSWRYYRLHSHNLLKDITQRVQCQIQSPTHYALWYHATILSYLW